MTLIDRRWWRRAGIGLVLVTGCSDDGLPADGGESGGTADAGASIDPSGVTTTMTTGATAGETGPTSASDSDPGGTSAGTATADGTADPTDDTADPTFTTEGGSSSSDSTGDAAATGTCEGAGDCVVFDSCCDCLALAVDEEPPACEIEECAMSACAALGLVPQVQCELDSCEFVPVSCSPFDVQCDEDAPPCADGTLASVDPLTGCWTGACVPAQHCDIVPSCEYCPADEVCVRRVLQNPAYRCSPIAAVCDGAATCECMGDAACLAPFDVCSEDADGLACGCPQC